MGNMRSRADRVAAACGLLGMLRRRARAGCTVLMYHRVLPDDQCAGYPLSNLVISETQFRDQVAWLGAACDSQTVDSMLCGSPILPTAGAGRGRPRVCITFDDGYWDNAEIAAPILERAGLRGTFYLASDFVEHGRAMWFDRAAAAWVGDRALVESVGAETFGRSPRDLDDWMGMLKADAPRRAAALDALGRGASTDLEPALNRPMTIEQASELSRRGHELGAHSRTHPILTQLDDARLADEVGGSIERVKRWARRGSVGFAYPNGTFDRRVLEAVRGAGASHACSTVRGLHRPGADVFAVQRRGITARGTTVEGKFSSVAMAAEVYGLHDLQRRAQRALRSGRQSA